MSDILREIEDARDLARSLIDLELRRHRRRLRVASEKRIKELTSGGEFDYADVAKTAVEDARKEIYGVDGPAGTKKSLGKGS